MSDVADTLRTFIGGTLSPSPSISLSGRCGIRPSGLFAWADGPMEAGNRVHRPCRLFVKLPYR